MRRIKNISEMLYDDLSLLYKAEKTHFETLAVIAKNVRDVSLKVDYYKKMAQLQRRINNLMDALKTMINSDSKGELLPNEAPFGWHNINERLHTHNSNTVSTYANTNHYDITDYHSAYSYAKASGQSKVALILQRILNDSEQEKIQKANEFENNTLEQSFS